MKQVEVWRGRHGDPVPLLGPLPGVRADDTVAYGFRLPDRFEPWPGRTLLERVFVLLDLGVSMSLPAWRSTRGTDRAKSGPETWYVDLVHVMAGQGSIIVRDLYIDVLVPTDGRHQRLLDLDEFADAIEAGQLDVGTAVDGLRRAGLISLTRTVAARGYVPVVPGGKPGEWRSAAWLRSTRGRAGRAHQLPAALPRRGRLPAGALGPGRRCRGRPGGPPG